MDGDMETVKSVKKQNKWPLVSCNTLRDAVRDTVQTIYDPCAEKNVSCMSLDKNWISYTDNASVVNFSCGFHLNRASRNPEK